MCKFPSFPSLLPYGQAHRRVPNPCSPLTSKNSHKSIFSSTRVCAQPLSPTMSPPQTHGLSIRVCPQPVFSPENFLPFTYGSVHGRVANPCTLLVFQTSPFAFLLPSICFVFVFFPSNRVQSFYKSPGPTTNTRYVGLIVTPHP